jgi:SAM-dependent methyltransferase
MYHFLLRTVPRPWLIRLSYVVRLFAPLLYRGDNVECTVCEGHFKKFLPYGYDGSAKRNNVLCPGCLTLERHRALWLFLRQRTDLFTRQKADVLHIAPEQPLLPHFRRQRNLRYVTADLVSPLADVKCDITAMPFADASYDVILCNHVLEHVDDDAKAMSELYRVLRPGGWAVLQVPIDYARPTTLEDPSIITEADRVKHYWQKDHVRLYGLDYADKLRAVGFIVTMDDLVPAMPAAKRERYRLQSTEYIPFCRKA